MLAQLVAAWSEVRLLVRVAADVTKSQRTSRSSSLGLSHLPLMTSWRHGHGESGAGAA